MGGLGSRHSSAWDSTNQCLGFEDNVLNISLEAGNAWDHNLPIL